MVYPPPFSSRQLEKIAGLWNENKWLPRRMGLNIVYPTQGSIPMPEIFSRIANLSEDKSLLEWALDKFREKYNQRGQSNPIADHIAESKYVRFVQRPMYNSPRRNINLNGCCVPGSRRVYVSVEGNFHLCERIATNAPPIGNVYSGVDIEIVEREYINRYKELNFPECSICWASKFCNTCYKEAFKNGVMYAGAELGNCASFKKSQVKFLQHYCMLMEDDPEGLDYLLELTSQ